MVKASVLFIAFSYQGHGDRESQNKVTKATIELVNMKSFFGKAGLATEGRLISLC